jgi:PAS domain S-box-containing protein
VRQRAEAAFREDATHLSEQIETLSAEDIRQMFHELRVHQIELEMQNEELRRTQAELAASRSRFFDLYDLAPVGYLTLSAAGVIKQANLTAVAMFGVTRETLVKRALSDFVFAEDEDAYYLHRKQLVEGGGRLAWESRLLKEHGASFWARLDATMMQDADGAPELRIVVGDISDRKALEISLTESEDKFRYLFEHSVIGKSLTSPSGEMHVNPAFCKMVGYTPAELRSLHWSKITHPEDIELTQKQIDALLRGERESVRFVKRFLHKSGAVVWTDVCSALRRNAVNAPMYLMTNIIDITERKADEDQLRKLSLAVEQSPESILITNVKSEIEYVNEAFIHSTGYSREELIGNTPRLLHSGKTPPETYVALWASLTKGQPWKGEFHNRRKDGSDYIEFAIITPLRQPDGTISHYVAVKEDISEKKRLGLELDEYRHHLELLVEARTTELVAARKQADAANIAKSSFLANMSHEIRTPMNGILGMANILRREGVSPQQARRLDTIDTAARHLLGVINDILDISKIEAGKFKLEEAPVSLQNLLANVVSILSEPCKAKDIQLRVEAAHVPPNLVGDATRLQQALLNYATNAVKFTKKGSVTLRTLLQEETADSLRLRFEVEDTGIGIEAEAMTRLFSAFEQADASMTRKYGGTGLGLTITKRLAELMGGTVGADSTPGVGSTFWFTVMLRKAEPFVEPLITALDAETQIRQRHAWSRILVVDDEPINREVARIQLEAADLVVDTAEDGAQAITMARAGLYAAIFMDMQMPNMNGLDATRQIRQLPEYKHVPIIAMTANVFDEDKAECLAAGMSDFLTKPFTPAELFATLLRAWTDGTTSRRLAELLAWTPLELGEAASPYSGRTA